MTTNTTQTRTTRGDSRSRIWLRQAWGFSSRCLREVSNSWTMLAVVLALAPGMQWLFASQGAEMSGEALASMAIGTGVFGAVYVCLYIFGYQLATDLEDRRYAAYRSMPLAPTADLAGRLLAGLVFATTTFALTLGVAVATGASFALRGPESILVVAFAFLITCIVWMIVAVPFVVYAKNKRIAEYAVPVIGLAGYIMTGYNGIAAEMSFVDVDLLNYLPNTLPTRVILYHLVPGEQWGDIAATPPSMPIGPEYLALLVGYAAVAVVVGTAIASGVLYKRGWWP